MPDIFILARVMLPREQTAISSDMYHQYRVTRSARIGSEGNCYGISFERPSGNNVGRECAVLPERTGRRRCTPAATSLRLFRAGQALGGIARPGQTVEPILLG
jgi:hypothetical protein